MAKRKKVTLQQRKPRKPKVKDDCPWTLRMRTEALMEKVFGILPRRVRILQNRPEKPVLRSAKSRVDACAADKPMEWNMLKPVVRKVKKPSVDNDSPGNSGIAEQSSVEELKRTIHPDKSLLKFFHIVLEMPVWKATPDHMIKLGETLIKGRGTKYEYESDGDKNYLYVSTLNYEDIVLCIAGRGRYKFVADDRFHPIRQMASNLKSSVFVLQLEEGDDTDSYDIVDEPGPPPEYFNISLYMVYKPHDPTWGQPSMKVKNIFDLLLYRSRDVSGRDGFSVKPNIETLYRVVKEHHVACPEEGDLPTQSEFLRPSLRPYQLQALQWMINRERKEPEPEPDPELEPYMDYGTGRKNRWFGTHIEVLLECGTQIYYNPSDGSLQTDKPIQPAMPRGGILADEMGLGKTVEILALILGNPRPKQPGSESTLLKRNSVTTSATPVKPEAVDVKVEGIQEVEAPNCVIKEVVMPLRNDDVGSRAVVTDVAEEGQLGAESEECAIGVKAECTEAKGEKLGPKIIKGPTRSKVFAKRGRKKKPVVAVGSMLDTLEATVVRGAVGGDDVSAVIDAVARGNPLPPRKKVKRLSRTQQLAIGFYNSQLETTVKKRKKEQEVECDPGPAVVCLCGAPPDTRMVQCITCQTTQHAKCVGIKQLPFQEPYFCPQCWQRMDLLPSGATLVVSPASICDQWVKEVENYISDPDFKIFVYKGVTMHNFVQPTDLAKCNFVMTTYDILRSELYFADLNHLDTVRLRNTKRFVASPSPLVCLQWWRICLDEAQMAQSAMSMVSKMAVKLEAVNRWAVTGTPLQKSIDDLFGTIHFLGVETYSQRHCWNELMYRPYLQHNRKPLYQLMSTLMWRTDKQDVLDQIQIPPQIEETHWVHFTPVEEHYYHREQETSSKNFLTLAREIVNSMHTTTRTIIKPVFLKCLDRSTLKKIMNPLLYLRQACTHLQARRGKNPVSGTASVTMEEVLDQMIKKTRTEGEEALRQHIAATNGIAALNIINQDWSIAVEMYRSILRLSEQYKDQLNVDKPQLVHTLHNLAEVLDAKHPSVAPNVRDNNLRKEAAEQEAKYMERYEKQLSVSVQQLKELEPTVEVCTEFWWSDLLTWLGSRGEEPEFLRRLEETYEQPYNQAQRALVSSFVGMNWELVDWSKRVADEHKKSKTSLAELEIAALEPALVEEANQCHLRTAPVKCKVCRICSTEDKLRTYEGVLFSIKGLNPKHSMVDDVVVFGQLPQGNWQGSDQEMCLKMVLACGRNKKADEKWLAAGRDHLKALDNMKKEFRRLRVVWTHLRDKVAARDELRMCRLRLRLLLPEELFNRSSADSRHLLSLAMVPWHYSELSEERSLAMSTLRRKIGTLQYLNHLRTSPDLHGIPEPCPICRGDLNLKWSVLRCGHVVCLDCLMSLGRQTVVCPLCRERTPHSAVSYVHAAPQQQEKHLIVKGSHSAKVTTIIRCLLRLRNDEPDVKVLVFSTWELVLDILGKALAENDVTFIQLPGSNFMQNVRKFKEDPAITALLLPLRTGSKGLNLTEASHLMFVEPVLDPADELQALGRIHRIGQTKETVVHRFLVHNTIEERIYRAVSANADYWEGDCVTVNQLIQLFTTTPTTRPEVDSDSDD